MGLGQVALEPDRLTVFGEGLAELALVLEAKPKCVVVRGEVGL